MFQKNLTFLFVSTLLFSSCMTRSPETSVLNSDEKELPARYLGFKSNFSTVTENSISEYDVGEVSTSTTFPEAYIALPNIDSFKNAGISLQAYLTSDDQPKKGYVAQFRNNSWQNYLGQELTRYRIGILGRKNAKLEIEIRGIGFVYKKTTFELGPGKVINPFLNLNILELDTTPLPWVKTLKERQNKLLTLQATLKDKDDSKVLRRFSIRQKREGGGFQTPDPATVIVTNKKLENIEITFNAQYGNESGKFTSGVKNYSSLVKFLETTSK